MYSPKIDERLIPVLYRTAKGQGIPMTVLVNRLLTQALAKEIPLHAEQHGFRVCEAPASETPPSAG